MINTNLFLSNVTNHLTLTFHDQHSNILLKCQIRKKNISYHSLHLLCEQNSTKENKILNITLNENIEKLPYNLRISSDLSIEDSERKVSKIEINKTIEQSNNYLYVIII